MIYAVPPYASKDTDKFSFIFASATIPHGITAHKTTSFEIEFFIYLFVYLYAIYLMVLSATQSTSNLK
jgi:hypothetical protein